MIGHTEAHQMIFGLCSVYVNKSTTPINGFLQAYEPCEARRDRFMARFTIRFEDFPKKLKARFARFKQWHKVSIYMERPDGSTYLHVIRKPMEQVRIESDMWGDFTMMTNTLTLSVGSTSDLSWSMEVNS